MAFNETYTATLSIKDVYGCLPECPKGHEIVHFRPPIKGECMIGHTEPQGHYEAPFDFPPLSPRLILRKIPRRRVIFEETGEERMAKDGEFVPSKWDGAMYEIHNARHCERPEHIFTRREETF